MFDPEFIKETASAINNIITETTKHLQRRIDKLDSKLEKVREYARRGEDCCTCPARTNFVEILELLEK